MWIFKVITDQLDRPGNDGFKFTIEAPKGVAKNLYSFKNIEQPVDDGGPGGVRCEVHYCKFGMEIKKPTYLWTNIASIIDELSTENETRSHPYLCCHGQYCHLGHGHHKQLGTGRPGGACSGAAPFPEHFVVWLVHHIVNRACAKRRSDEVMAWTR